MRQSFKLRFKTSPKMVKLRRVLARGVLLLVLALVALNIDYNFGPESTQLKSVDLVRDMLVSKKDYTGDFLFIDVSASKALIDREDGSGNHVITDRDMLIELFTVLAGNKRKHDLVLCDLLFDQEAAVDSVLGDVMAKVPGLIIPFSEPVIPEIKAADVSMGDAGYQVSSGFNSYSSLLKYQYYTPEGRRAIPLMMVEEDDEMKSVNKFGLIWLGNSVFFNNTIPNDRIKMSDLNYSKGKSLIYPLKDILSLLKANEDLFYQKFFAGKHIVIGDFENDLHETYLGVMPGPLILTNLFLGMHEKDNRIEPAWLAFLYFSFVLVSWLLLYPPYILTNAYGKLRKSKLGLLAAELLTFYIVIWIISLISSLVFHKHIDVFLIALYLSWLGLDQELVEKPKIEKHAAVTSRT